MCWITLLFGVALGVLICGIFVAICEVQQFRQEVSLAVTMDRDGKVRQPLEED